MIRTTFVLLALLVTGAVAMAEAPPSLLADAELQALREGDGRRLTNFGRKPRSLV